MPSLEPREGRCGARIQNSIKKHGQILYCENWPEPGRRRCKYHGGRTPRGTESPNWKGRGYSRDIPTRLADRFRAALDDPELTSLTSEIALIDARLGELLEKVPEGEHWEAWAGVQEALAPLRAAVEEEDLEGQQFWLGKIEDAVQKTDREFKVWKEVYGAIGERRKLADTERKREEMLSANMTARQAMAFVAAVQTAIMEEIVDPLPTAAVLRQRLGSRLRFLLGVEARYVEDGKARPKGDAARVMGVDNSRFRAREVDVVDAEIVDAEIAED